MSVEGCLIKLLGNCWKLYAFLCQFVNEAASLDSQRYQVISFLCFITHECFMMKSNTKVIFLIMLIFFLYYVFSLLFLNECIYYWVINIVSYTSSNDYRTPFNIDCWKFLESKYMQKVKLYLHYSPIRSKHFSENEIQGYYYISAPISRSNFRKTCATFS